MIEVNTTTAVKASMQLMRFCSIWTVRIWGAVAEWLTFRFIIIIIIIIIIIFIRTSST